MTQRTFTCNPNEAMSKMEELEEKGWKIIASANTSTPSTECDAHGISYGGAEFTILCERVYEKPSILANNRDNGALSGRPCNPPRPGGR